MCDTLNIRAITFAYSCIGRWFMRFYDGCIIIWMLSNVQWLWFPSKYIHNQTNKQSKHKFTQVHSFKLKQKRARKEKLVDRQRTNTFFYRKVFFSCFAFNFVTLLLISTSIKIKLQDNRCLFSSGYIFFITFFSSCNVHASLFVLVCLFVLIFDGMHAVSYRFWFWTISLLVNFNNKTTKSTAANTEHSLCRVLNRSIVHT